MQLPPQLPPATPLDPEPEPVVAADVVEQDAGPAPLPLGQDIAHAEAVKRLCEEIGNKLGSVSVADCQRQGLRFGGAFSIHDRPLVYKELAPAGSKEQPFRVFMMGGIHGDEYSSFSIIFKWLDLYRETQLAGEFHWRIAPLANPDGLLGQSPAQRQNANGVDLNRNFPSLDWFDGPAEAPDRIGELYLHQLGVYPGSLGNYAGLDKRIPVVTLELPSAGIMPETEQIHLMWDDLVAWLDREGR